LKFGAGMSGAGGGLHQSDLRVLVHLIEASI
jgi:hypothetical protein